MKSNIFCVVTMSVLVSCLPSAPRDGTNYGGTRSDEFDIQPEGTWLSSCRDIGDSSSAAQGQGLPVAQQMKVIFAEKEPSFTLEQTLLSQNCKEDKPAVALQMHIKGKISYGKHTALDDSRRARAVEVEVSSVSHTPKSETGLSYLKAIVNDELGNKASIGKETVMPSDLTPKKLYGILAVKKNVRNAMHVYLHNEQQSAQKIAAHLDNSNLYVHYLVK